MSSDAVVTKDIHYLDYSQTNFLLDLLLTEDNE